MTTFSDWNLRKARKHHTCSECTDYIHPDDSYSEVRWLDDGEWFRSKICLPCRSLLDRQKGYELYELHEWIWGRHDTCEVVRDPEMLAFHIRWLKGSAARARGRGDESSRLRHIVSEYETMAELLLLRVRAGEEVSCTS